MQSASQKRSSDSIVSNEDYEDATRGVKRDPVEQINSLDHATFEARFVDRRDLAFKPATIARRLEYKSITLLTKAELAQCLILIELTSKHDYEASSMGWHPRQKRKEMSDKDMHYVLVSTLTDAGAATTQVEGFLSFMITYDSTPAVPVLYIYEIHLAQSLRGIGLGSKLMAVVTSIAAKTAVQKVMLTCFLSNRAAMTFYERHGFAKDVCSPEDRITRRKVVKADYMIMSKDMVDDGVRSVED